MVGNLGIVPGLNVTQYDFEFGEVHPWYTERRRSGHGAPCKDMRRIRSGNRENIAQPRCGTSGGTNEQAGEPGPTDRRAGQVADMDNKRPALLLLLLLRLLKDDPQRRIARAA